LLFGSLSRASPATCQGGQAPEQAQIILLDGCAGDIEGGVLAAAQQEALARAPPQSLVAKKRQKYFLTLENRLANVT